MEAKLDRVTPTLAEAVRLRNIPQTLEIIGENIDVLDTLTLPPDASCLCLYKKAIPFLAYCAWAIDFHAPYLERVERCLPRFKQLPLGELTMGELGRLLIAEGLLKFHDEDYDEAKALFDQVKDYADHIDDTELMTVSRYYLGRVLWRQIRYPEALELIRDAKELDSDSGHTTRVAAMELDEGWLLFLQGKVEEAQQVLHQARAVLEQTDAWVDLGNVLSFQGRIHRKSGEYDKALDCFAQAIDMYRRHHPIHRNVARAHRNRAFVYRVQARDLIAKPTSQHARPQVEAEVRSLRAKAFAELGQAQKIYLALDAARHTYELGILHITRASIYSDADELDRAEAEAKAAYEYGEAKNNKVVMAEARVIQSKLALSRGGRDDARRSLDLANEAIELANDLVHHRRLLARAHIRKGYALLDSTHDDSIGARTCWEQARARLVTEDRDYLRKSLDALDECIRSKGHSRSFLYQLTEAAIEGKTLKELATTFEETLIRFVYERCDRNIARAAKKLKTNERTVRHAVATFRITDQSLKEFKRGKVGGEVFVKLKSLKGKEVQGRSTFVIMLKKAVGKALRLSEVMEHVDRSVHR
nr:TPR repeat-containing protein [uncultured bacterium]